MLAGQLCSYLRRSLDAATYIARRCACIALLLPAAVPGTQICAARSLQSLSEEDVENALADDDGFDTQVFSTILDAIQQDKLKGQAAFEAAARHAFEDGLVRHGRKINGHGIRSVLPSTDAEAAMIARSSGGSHPESSGDSGDAVEVQMRVVVGQLRMEMPWLHCLWNHVRHAVSSLWGRRGTEPVAGPRRHSVAKRHAAVASPSTPQDQIDEVGLLFKLELYLTGHGASLTILRLANKISTSMVTD